MPHLWKKLFLAALFASASILAKDAVALSVSVPPSLFSGVLEVPPALQKEAEALNVIFIIGRGPQNQIAVVKKLTGPFKFPVVFSLSPEDAMTAGGSLPAEFNVTARLDQDGNANPAQSGDIVGKADAPVKAGASNLRILLNEKVK